MSAKLPSAWTLWKQAWSSFRARFWRYILIVLVIMVPTTVLNAVSTGDTTVIAYGSLATLFMNAALLYAIVRSDQAETKLPKLRNYYYDSSASLVRYIIVGIVLATMLIPAALGLGLVGLGGGVSAVPSAGELILLSIVGLILASPSIYLLIRNGLALIDVFVSDAWPGQTLRRSRELTKGYFWAILGRYLQLALGLIVVALPIAFVFIGLYVVTQSSVFLDIYQILNAALILPLFYLFLFRLYVALDKQATK